MSATTQSPASHVKLSVDSPDKPKLLIIGWVWPEPNSSAAGYRMMQLVALFQEEGYQITFASAAQRSEHMVDLDSLGIACQDIRLNCDSFDTWVEALSPDVVMYDRYMIEEQFGWRVAKRCPNAIRILDTEDLQSLRNARHHAYKATGSLDTTDLQTELAIREVAAILRCDLTIMISPAEIKLLEDVYQVPSHLLSYLPFFFEQEALTKAIKPYDAREHFVSIGNFRHAPNWDSVLWLKQQIWPKIRKQLPEAELHIYGAYPPKKATDLHCAKSGFFVKGWADDAYQVVEQARVLLAPLRFGAGIKGKLADAMLCGTPSVTTDIGVEGMETDNPWAGAVANDIDDIVDNAIELYQSETCWQAASQLAEENRKILFAKGDRVTQFFSQIAEIVRDVEAYRSRNFIGLMLNHHSHKSSQYMSQWIAAKNASK